MKYTGLVMLLVLGQSPATDPSVLVSQLGSPRYSQRQEASASLEKLGKSALPALRSARAGKDPEIRSRAASLVSRIEGAILTRPSSIVLNFKDASVTEVLRSVGEQSGVKLVLRPENAPVFRDRRLSLEQTEAVTFWKALDLIADTARLQFSYGSLGSMSGREPEFPLFDGGSRPLLPSNDSGPFRVIVTGLHYQRDVNFTGVNSANAPRFAIDPKVRATTSKAAFPAMIHENCNVQIHVVGEPRFTIAQNGPLRITEALDEKGQSLAVRFDTNAEQNADVFQRSAGYFGYASGSVLQIQAQLNRPAVPGMMIKSLKGNVPVSLSTKKPDPLVVPLKNSTGRTFQNEDLALTLHAIRTSPEPRQTTIEISIRPQRKAEPSAPIGPTDEGSSSNRPDLVQQQIDVVDHLGRPILWYPSQFDAENGRMTLTLTPVDPSMTPVEVRYHSIARATTEVCFEFHDLPLP